VRTNAQNQFNKFYPVRLPRRPVHAMAVIIRFTPKACAACATTAMNGQVEYSNEPDDHDFGLLYQVSRRTES
jgi:hypothetical protein